MRTHIANLEQQNSDLELELQAAIEHGDAIEAELALANDQMRGEIAERIRADVKLQRLLTALKEQKSDLELLVHTITEHSDEIDVEHELTNEQLRLENERIRLAKEQAETMARIKAEFVAVVSHEVRTPMNGLLGMARLLLDTELTHEQRDLADTVVSSGRLLLNILDDILDLSKLEASRLHLENIDFNLVQLVEESLGLMSMRASERGLAVAHVIAPDIAVMAKGDPMRLRQVLTNLIGNATKFTEKGSITVSVSPTEKGHVRFAISDTGIGISPEVQERLFNRYVQGDTWVSRKFGGTGLGLSICKQLVELMGGEIGVDSTPGAGSVFWFEMPLGHAGETRPRAHPTAAPKRVVLVEPDFSIRTAMASRLGAWGVPVVTALPDSITSLRQPGDVLLVGARLARTAALALSAAHGLPTIISSPAGTLPQQAAGGDTLTLAEPVAEAALAAALDWSARSMEARKTPPCAPAPMPRRTDPGHCGVSLRILVVEDNPVNQRVAVGMLARQRHVVVTADNGAEGIERLQAEPFDLVLMDRHMPVMDGLEAVRTLRALPPPLCDLPVVALTAAASQAEIRECLDAGMNDFVPKPFSPEQLVEVIDRMMAQQAGRDGDLDPTVLATLRDVLGDETVAEIVAEYGRTAKSLLNDITAATTMRDGKALAYAAHSLKSSSAMLGLVAMDHMCAGIEAAIRVGKLEDALALAARLPEGFARAQARLQRR
ncbi:MAG: response regulator [Rhodospirillaceae bacterium]|nr:response regulator [Rhodospirillales bacterium]